MTQPARDTVPLHRRPHRFGHHQTYLRTGDVSVAGRVAPGMHHQIRLGHPYALPHRDTEIRRPCHPVLGRKHRLRPRVESRSQRTATLAAACRHDRATGARAHPQPETVHTGPAAVVRLKSPLALGHGCLSSFDVVPTSSTATHVMADEDASTVGKLIHPAYLAAAVSGSGPGPGSGRIATCGRLLEGTDENCLGQTWPDPPRPRRNRSPRGTKVTYVTNDPPPQKNPLAMLQNGWHSERKLLASGNAVLYLRRRRTQSGDDHRPRAHRPPSECDELRHTASAPPDNATTATDRCPQAVDNHVDSLLLSPPGHPEEAMRG